MISGWSHRGYKFRLQQQACVKFRSVEVGIETVWALFKSNDEKHPGVVQSTEGEVDIEESIMPLLKRLVPWQAKAVSLGWKNEKTTGTRSISFCLRKTSPAKELPMDAKGLEQVEVHTLSV